jgi:hypothetical protein
MERSHTQTQLIAFLCDELALEEAVIAIALKHRDNDTDPLHMILWNYGLISIEQLNQIFDWLIAQIPILDKFTILSNSLRNSP